MKVYYKFSFPQNDWGGIRASLFINGIVWMLIPIVCPIIIIFTSNDKIDWQVVICMFLMGLIAMFLGNIYWKPSTHSGKE